MNSEEHALLSALDGALDRLTEHPIGALIPEVRSNLGFAVLARRALKRSPPSREADSPRR